MRQFLELRSTIHAIKRNQDNSVSSSTSNANHAAAQSCGDFLDLPPASTDNLSNGLLRDIARFGSATSISNTELINLCRSNSAVGYDDNDDDDDDLNGNLNNGDLTDIDGTIEYLPEFRMRTVSLVHGSRSEVPFLKPRTMTFSSGSKKHDRCVFQSTNQEIAC